MNAKILSTAALLLAAVAGGSLLGAPAHAQKLACWAGYHVDNHGDCQPNNPIPDRYCSDGLQYQPYTGANGWRCVPIPRGY